MLSIQFLLHRNWPSLEGTPSSKRRLPNGLEFTLNKWTGHKHTICCITMFYICVTCKFKTLLTLRFILIIFLHLLHICFVFLWSCNTDTDIFQSNVWVVGIKQEPLCSHSPAENQRNCISSCRNNTGKADDNKGLFCTALVFISNWGRSWGSGRHFTRSWVHFATSMCNHITLYLLCISR